jgi:hypothetical protein
MQEARGVSPVDVPQSPHRLRVVRASFAASKAQLGDGVSSCSWVWTPAMVGDEGCGSLALVFFVFSVFLKGLSANCLGTCCFSLLRVGSRVVLWLYPVCMNVMPSYQKNNLEQ